MSCCSTRVCWCYKNLICECLVPVNQEHPDDIKSADHSGPVPSVCFKMDYIFVVTLGVSCQFGILSLLDGAISIYQIISILCVADRVIMWDTKGLHIMVFSLTSSTNLTNPCRSDSY